MSKHDANGQARRRRTAVRARHAGKPLFYGVKTTGIFCRAGCPSKPPKRENVVFFDSALTARQAGFRPCKRCQPTGPEPARELEERMQRAAGLLALVEPRLTVRSVADSVGMSVFHFHRRFRAVMGVSPKQYQAGRRLQRFRAQLRQGGSVTRAIYDAGFGSASRAYEHISDRLGMGPRQYQNGGLGVEIVFDVARTGLGWVLVGATSKGVCAIEIGHNAQEVRERLRESFPRAELRRDRATLRVHMKRLKEYLAQPGRGLFMAVDMEGTPFQCQVWAALRRVPAGETVTYEELARQVGRPGAARAVGAACAANRVAVAIPCHRVVRKDGSLGGYRWGVVRKQALLQAERRDAMR